MKNIITFVNEKFKLSSNNIVIYKPTSRKELRDIIIKILEEDGPDADLNNIDTSKITDMNHLFARIARRVGDIDVSKWNVSNVENMSFMFCDCKKFNCDISKWNVSHVTDMSSMFNECELFNQDLSDWDVSSVENFTEMFENCRAFNSNLQGWDLKSAKDVSNMFFGARNFEGKGLDTWKLPEACWRRSNMLTDTAIKNKDIFK